MALPVPTAAAPAFLVAQEVNLLGDNLLAWLTLSIGGALFAGTALALLRPPQQTEEGQLERAPLGRSLVQIAIGLVASIWALATLIS
jgi:peptidoglycan/LPS O-acetylase OafA/YrhL